jgi:hypothetical protein
MKKIFVILALAASLMMGSSRSAKAQVFNHASIGVTLGTTGVGLELAAPLGNQLRVRAGYSFFPPVWKPNKVVSVNWVELGVTSLDLEAIPNLGGAKLLFDWHPGGGSFFFTAGVYGLNQDIITVRNRVPFLDKEDWASLGLHAGDFIFMTDDKGILKITCSYWKIRPYAGLGFGKALDPDKTVTFKTELGVQYGGPLTVYGYGYDPATGKNSMLPITSKAIANYDEGIIDKISGIPVFPVLQFGLYVKLF